MKNCIHCNARINAADGKCPICGQLSIERRKSSERRKQAVVSNSRFLMLLTCLAVVVCFYVFMMVNNPQLFGWLGDGSHRLTLSGSGTENRPYLIKNAANMTNLAQAVNAGRSFAGEYIRLERDISLLVEIDKNEHQLGWTPIGESFMYSFSGVFDGGGYTISGLWIDNEEAPYIGLFGHTLNAEIRNLNLEVAEGKSIRGGQSAGVLMGIQGGENSLVDNCTAIGEVQVVENGSFLTMAGGLIGGANGTVSNCVASVNVTVWGGAQNDAFAGGLIGSSNGNIYHSFARGDVTVFPKEGYDGEEHTLTAGGLVGDFFNNNDYNKLEHSNASGTILVKTDSFHEILAGGLVGIFRGEITGAGNSGIRYSSASGDVFVQGVNRFDQAERHDGSMVTAGGLVALIWGGEVTDCFATGQVYANGGQDIAIGGLTGMLSFNGNIARCYAVGRVACSDSALEPYQGGLVGEHYTMRFHRAVRIENSFYDRETTGQRYLHDSLLPDEMQHDADFTLYPDMARSTAEMQTQATFTGWDFDTVWIMPAHGGYPALR